MLRIFLLRRLSYENKIIQFDKTEENNLFNTNQEKRGFV